MKTKMHQFTADAIYCAIADALHVPNADTSDPRTIIPASVVQANASALRLARAIVEGDRDVEATACRRS